MTIGEVELKEAREICEARGECAGPMTTFPDAERAHVAIVCRRGNWPNVVRWLAACERRMVPLLDEVERLRKERDELAATHPKCATCDKLATCCGRYDDSAPAYACDACCGHGCEDGKCVPLAEVPAWVETVDLNVARLADERDAAVREAARLRVQLELHDDPEEPHNLTVTIAPGKLRCECCCQPFATGEETCMFDEGPRVVVMHRGPCPPPAGDPWVVEWSYEGGAVWPREKVPKPYEEARADALAIKRMSPQARVRLVRVRREEARHG